MQDINILSLFWQAGLVVKLVMLTLLAFSIISWFIIYQKFQLFKEQRLNAATFLDGFWNSKSLAEANRIAEEMPGCAEAMIFQAGYGELQKLERGREQQEDRLSGRLAGMTNLERVLAKSQSLETGRLQHNLSFLATTGSSTPFIGLFGTVWGIMVSFHEIGAHGSASLAVVAPGISEALVATAAGLAVAIPAVIFYNHYSHKLEGVENSMASFAADLLNLVERDLISRIQETGERRQGDRRQTDINNEQQVSEPERLRNIE